MKAVSTAFKNAALSATVIPVRQTQIQLVDNQSIGASLMATASQSEPVYCPAQDACNGIFAYGAKWAFPDPFAEGSGGRFLCDGTLFPIDSAYEGGWQGTVISDNSGNIAGGEALVITYSAPVTIGAVQFWADSFLGYPVNFVIDYDPTGSAGYTTIVTVTGNSLPQYNYIINNITVKLLRITVTKINYGQQPVRMIEFQGGYLIDASAGVSDQDILQERFSDSVTLLTGTGSAGQLTLDQDNTGNLWGPHSTSPYAQYLRANRRIYVKVGFQYADGSTELVALGTFYSMDWQAQGGQPLATVKAQDRMKKLRDLQYRKCIIQVGKTVDACIRQALIDAGLGTNEFVLAASSNVIPYAFAQPTQTFQDYISKLAMVDGGVVFFDENDVFHFQDVNYLHNNSTVSQLTLTDANAVISTLDEWSDGESTNRVTVNVNALKLAALAVMWNLQETLTVSANGTLTVYATLQSPATGITSAPTFTAGPDITLQSWQAYAQLVIMVFANAAGSPETITACSISGQGLQADGQNIVIAETAAVTSQLDPPREYNVNNPFVQNSATANTLASNLLTLYSNPPSKLHVDAVGLPHLELGDRITVNSAQAGINADYWVIRHEFSDNGGFSSSLDLYAAV